MRYLSLSTLGVALIGIAASVYNIVVEFVDATIGHAFRFFDFALRAFRYDPAPMPPQRSTPSITRRIQMSATALNDRILGGVHIRGFLGLPTVRMLAG